LGENNRDARRPPCGPSKSHPVHGVEEDDYREYDYDEDYDCDNASLQTDVTDSDWGNGGGGYDDDEYQRGNNVSGIEGAGRRGGGPPQASTVLLSEADIEICQRLDQEYELALEERDVAYMARYQSVRQSALLSVVFMGLFLTLANVFFLQQTDWNVTDSVFFSVYTITTVGYGHLQAPETPAFQIYTIFFLLTGISLLTIMVAQVYQCLALEASRAQHSRDSRLFADTLMRPSHHGPPPPAGPSSLSAPAVTAPPESSSSQPADQDATVQSQLSAETPPAHLGVGEASAESRREPSAAPVGAAAAASSRSLSGSGHPLASSPPAAMEFVYPDSHWVDWVWYVFDKSRHFFYETEFGRSISVLFPFLGLILIGATVIGSIEGWTVVESLYFAVVSLTTTGFGNYFPTRTASVVFCILWLPFSVGFMSLFLANVAAFYIRLSDRNIERMERRLRRQVARAKAEAERELDDARRRALRGQELRHVVEAPTGDDNDDGGGGGGNLESSRAARANKRRGFDTVPTDDTHDGDDDEESSSNREESTYELDAERGTGGHNSLAPSHRPARNNGSRALFGSRNSPRNRREVIIRNCRKAWRFSRGYRPQRHRSRAGNSSSASSAGSVSSDDSLTRPQHATMATMRDVLRTVRRQMAEGGGFRGAGPESEFLSIRSSRMVRNRLETDSGPLLKPSFALRSLVQERLSEIIALEVAGYSSSIEIHDNTLTVTIDSLRQTADKWLIPRRARKAFRAVCFEALFFVGEHGLIVRGADALFDLTPIEFHGLFAPLLAAMGDAETMESWLASTQVLAEVDLKREPMELQQFLGRKPPYSGAVRMEIQRGLPTTAGIERRPLSKPPLQLTTPGNAFAAARDSMQFA
jgi:hypothetical protein